MVLLQILQSIFSALLPPHDGVPYEYYDVLGLRKYASITDIKTAYKKQSLRYHPDKVRTDKIAAAATYERIQEANTVLKDENKRKLYHELQCSVARFRFVENGELFHVMAVHQNLLRASWLDKTRLIVMAVLIIGMVLLQPILVAIKLNGFLQQTSWMVLFIPLFVFQGIHWIFHIIFIWWDPSLLLGLLEASCWYSGMLLLTYQWQTNRLDYGVVAIPFFIGILVRLLAYIWQLRSIRTAQGKMVSEQYVAEVLHPNTNSDETTAEIDDDKYIVVHADEPSVVAAMGMMDQPPSREDIEAIRVATSEEYQAADDAADAARRRMCVWILIYLPFVVLTTLQLKSIIDVSWWIVFIPVWLWLFVQLCRNLFVCLCMVPPGFLEDEIEDEEALGESTDDRNVPTSHYFKAPDSEMSAFAEWDGSHLTSDRIAQVRTEEMGVADIEEGGSMKEGNVGVDPDAGEAKVEAASAEQTVDNGEADVEGEPKPSEAEAEDEDNKPLEEDEAEYMQAKFQACTVSCSLCLEVVVLCLVVGLVQKPGAYNAFWVLFPVFLVTAMVLACICCCVYARELPSMPDLDGPDEENPNPVTGNETQNPVPENTSGDKPIALQPEDAVDVPAASPADDIAQSEETARSDKDATELSAMDELD